jgi:hypothetical protein
MFRKILIANRGEIALRVIHACREMGIQTVAVYSEIDSGALHARMADESVCVGPAESAMSYLNIPNILSAAEITGAEAIHPGYGFLAENAHFAEVCQSVGITFIGPPAENIALMGDKAKAREIMMEHGIPVMPGSKGVVEGEKQILELAKQIGYPLIIKAVAGGGGRGMRVVTEEDELIPSYQTAQSEAKSAVFHGAPAHRGSDHFRRERRVRLSRRKGLLHPAPAPETDRRVSLPGGGRGASPRVGGRRRQGGPERQVPERRNRGVPSGQGPGIFFHGDEHPDPGGTSGDRNGHRN